VTSPVLRPDDVIRLEGDAVALLDQTLLPGERRDRRCRDVAALIVAIRELAIRGAPSLGVAGAMGVALAALLAPDDEAGFRAAVAADAASLAQARPTAVNLAWGVAEALEELAGPWRGADAARVALARRARALQEDEVERGRRMGAHLAALLPDDARVLTQCNAGALACGGYGSALGVARTLHEDGRGVHVWVPETRPLLQGARLTAWECAEDGIPHTLVTDNAAATIFAAGEVDAVIVGADRIAVNGDVANKIGTYALAVLADHHGVPFYVVAPSSTIDPATPDGAAIPIEERDRDEVASFGTHVTAPAGTAVRNPAFDVTPAALIGGIATEDGVIRPPYALAGERPRAGAGARPVA